MKKVLLFFGLMLTQNVFAAASPTSFEDFESAEAFVKENMPKESQRIITEYLQAYKLSGPVEIDLSNQNAPGSLLLKKIVMHFLPVYQALPKSHKKLVATINYVVLDEEFDVRFYKLGENGRRQLMTKDEAEIFILCQLRATEVFVKLGLLTLAS